MNSWRKRTLTGWSWLSVAGLFTLGCGGDSPATARGSGSDAGVVVLGLPSELPSCNFLRRTQVFYVSSEDQYYYCNGSAMLALEPSAPPLVRSESEPPGDRCPTGGTVIFVGSDEDTDGELDESEVTSTDYVCHPGLVAPSMLIDEQSEMEALRGVFWIAGMVRIVGDLDLSALAGVTKISGALYIQENDSLVDLTALRRLSEVEGTLYVADNAALINLDGLEALTDLRGSLYVEDNEALTDISALGGLTGVGGVLLLAELDALTSLDGLDNLATVEGSLAVVDNPSLSDITALAGLTSAAGLGFERNPSLLSLSGLEGLTSAGYLSLVQNGVTNVDALSSLASVDNLYLAQNDALTTLRGLAALEAVGTLSVREHANLPACEVQWLIESVDDLGEIGDTSNNTGTGTCPP